MKKTKKVNPKTKTQPKKKLFDELKAVDEYENLQAIEEQNKVEQQKQKQKKVNYEDLKLSLVQVSEQMKKFLNENSGDYRIRRVYKVNYDIERLIKGF